MSVAVKRTSVNAEPNWTFFLNAFIKIIIPKKRLKEIKYYDILYYA